MLRYFPASFPDETLYSRLCRYHRLSGQEVDRASLHELIGGHTHVVVSALPSKLDTLVSRLPNEANVSVDDIASNNTLLAFYTAFMPARRASSVYAAMRGDSASGIKMSIGLIASRLGGHNQLRFCRICAQEEYFTTGQPYWHRVHQLPGVLVCPVHKQTLCALAAETIELNRHKLLLPDDKAIAGHLDDIHLSDIQQETALRLALLSGDVLHGRMQTKGAEGIHRLHRSSAAAHGLIRANGRIRIDDLDQLIGLYCNCLPVNIEFSVVRCRLFDCALNLLRKPREAIVHPMLHIVLMDCLRCVEDRPNLQCAEAVPDMPLTSRARKIIDLSVLAEKLSFQGATLSGVAGVMGISVTTAAVEAARAGIRVSKRPKHLTAERVTDVGTSLRLGLCIEEVAQRHAISIVSVYRILRMDAALAQEYEAKLFALLREQYRQRYMDSRSDKAAYAWLRRHDGLWLTEQLKTFPAMRTRKRCVDWRRRDTALARQIFEIEAQLRSMPGKPTYINETKLKRLTSMADTIEHSLSNLPLTEAALKTCAESAQAHQRRRIMWAYCELKKRPDFHHQLWEVLRLAGVRKLHPSNEALAYTLL
ncbi:hypothetical protein CSQ93_08430 [Janthinobacterium sp. BJB426]|uniref:TnsD family Tn7-like transposition protein n=1 Tax=Janthinobacterium sp. BJB426 TaxID=2048010 RepID=UPI000C10D7F0|nr:TnsD family Tn7-like transposition protein [Janthinobacterium sp. BJB426]PHV28334.1 hypothetical protein CSQ93_08430 [Janthinobacterium sp. BJB426]